MKPRLARPIALLLAAACAGPAVAQSATAAAVAEHRARELQRIAGIPGMAVAVGVRDAVVWAFTLGLANVETPAPVTGETKFRAASVSKVITAAALARLAAAGTIDLDAPVAAWFPALPAPLRDVTPRQLAAHLAGVRHYERKDFGPEAPGMRHFDSLEEALVVFRDDPLVVDPGSEYRYSTYGYTLLGAVMEKASGQPFLALVEREVFAPLGMRHSAGDVAQAVVPGRTGFYQQVDGGRLAHPRPEDSSFRWPGGGLLTTPEDLVRFGLAHLRPGYLPAPLLAELFTPQALPDGESTGVGLGWRIGGDAAGRTIRHHSGSMSGARSSLVLYPEAGVAAALMTNLTGGPPSVESTLQWLADPFLPPTAAPGEPPLGAFAYTGRMLGRDLDVPMTGWIHVLPGPDLVTGQLALPPAAVERWLAQHYPRTEALPIAGWERAGDQEGFVLVAPSGLAFAPVERTADGFRLTADLAGVRYELEARHDAHRAGSRGSGR
ncbi:MAG TPA: serine hydrolase domain-containing protein [Thermoanaerobaculia bacterium]|nr:serine hydrolase domain-containing protein [Thermoanaerobaculia bacterium]